MLNQHTSEWVSTGHPDKTADYVSSYLLDRYLEKDPHTRFAVEVMIKDRMVTLGGEVTSNAEFSSDELASFVRQAVNEIGYTREYQDKWGKENTICGNDLVVQPYISQQSADIDKGVSNAGWGDQGIFFGMAVNAPKSDYMPRDYYLARKLGKALYDSGLGGLDIKTQVTIEDGGVKQVVVAIPLLDDDWNGHLVREMAEAITNCRNIILNGTGRYVTHSSVADCGVTGRKLVADLYGSGCKIGGGSPWTKDGTKADLTLNIAARRLAMDAMRDTGRHKILTELSCSIGSPEVNVVYLDGRGNHICAESMTLKPKELIAAFGLDKPGFATRCREGLFYDIK